MMRVPVTVILIFLLNHTGGSTRSSRHHGFLAGMLPFSESIALAMLAVGAWAAMPRRPRLVAFAAFLRRRRHAGRMACS
jgi:hydrogenase/urease accessory protein HupE